MTKAFTGVWIPRNIYEDGCLKPTDKLILSDIFNLCSEGGCYFKTNETISAEINISVPSVTRSIKKLIELKFILCEFNGRSRLIKMTTPLIKLIKQPNQIDEAASSKRLDSIQESTQDKKQVSKGVEIIYPYDSEIFIQTWMIWLQERKDKKLKKYTQRGEQAQLHNLQKISNNDEATAIKVIEQSITQGWAGLFAIKGGKTNRKALDADKAFKWAYGK